MNSSYNFTPTHRHDLYLGSRQAECSYGTIITSRYDVVRYSQDNSPVCYNATLAMFMNTTQPLGSTYMEMAYHDFGRYGSDYDNCYRGSIITDLNDNNINRLKNTRMQYDFLFNELLYRNAIENKLTITRCMNNGGDLPDLRGSMRWKESDCEKSARMYIQAFERILSEAPVIACADMTPEAFPDHIQNNSVHYDYHAFLIHGIIKGLYQGETYALLVCVDPLCPQYDRMISIFDFADGKRSFILSDRPKVYLNSLPKQNDWNDLPFYDIPIGICREKTYSYSKYQYGTNPRVVRGLTRM